MGAHLPFSHEEVDFGVQVGFVCGLVALFLVIWVGGCSDPPQNRSGPTPSLPGCYLIDGYTVVK